MSLVGTRVQIDAHQCYASQGFDLISRQSGPVEKFLSRGLICEQHFRKINLIGRLILASLWVYSRDQQTHCACGPNQACGLFFFVKFTSKEWFLIFKGFKNKYQEVQQRLWPVKPKILTIQPFTEKNLSTCSVDQWFAKCNRWASGIMCLSILCCFSVCVVSFTSLFQTLSYSIWTVITAS